MTATQLQERRRLAPVRGARPAVSGFNSLGEFAAAVALNERSPGSNDLYKRLASGASGASEYVPSDGGFLLQPDFSAQILMQVYDTGRILAACQQIPITNPRSTGIKFPQPDEQSRQNGSRFGGVSSAWLNEAVAPSTSKPKFRLAELSLKKLIVEVIVTDELLADVAALDTWLLKILGLELAFRAEAAIVAGSGAGLPQGILSSPALLTIAKQSGQASATIVSENIENMVTRLWSPTNESVWLAEPSTKGQLIAMSKAVGTAGSVSQYYRFACEPGEPDMLCGFPVFYPEYMQQLGVAGDILLCNPSRYAWASKTPQGEVSMHLRFLTDEMTYRLVWRVDGQAIDNTPITPFNGGPTLSPFVALAQR
jgi:HK97 family phage major capsid protein